MTSNKKHFDKVDYIRISFGFFAALLGLFTVIMNKQNLSSILYNILLIFFILLVVMFLLAYVVVYRDLNSQKKLTDFESTKIAKRMH